MCPVIATCSFASSDLSFVQNQIHIPQKPIFSVGTLYEEPDSTDDFSPIELRRRSRGWVDVFELFRVRSLLCPLHTCSPNAISSFGQHPFILDILVPYIRHQYNPFPPSVASASSLNHLSFASFSSSFSSGSLSLRPPYAAAPYSSSTDGKSVLTMDGGGVRGIFAPLFLLALQKHLPEGIDVRSLLDLVGGTSTGGVAALHVRPPGSLRREVP